MAGIDFIATCAPTVSPVTMQRVIAVESEGNSLALNVNIGRTALSLKPRDKAEAVKLTYEHIANGHSVDMGLMQVNSKNLARLGYTVEDMFDECKNLNAGAIVLTQYYRLALPQYNEPQAALQAALSAYNTGSFTNGFANGYVSKYVRGLSPIYRTSVSAPKHRIFKPGEANNPFTAPSVMFSRQQQSKKE
jgi:type IV secretion system protein VirB1